jgi:hypothetical protein
MANALIVKPLPFTATSTATGLGDPNYLGNDYAGIVWRSTAIAAPSVKLDLGGDRVVDTVMLFGIASSADLAGATVQIYGATAAEGPTRARGDGGRPLLAGSIMPQIRGGVAFLPLPADWPALRYLEIALANGGAWLQLARAVVGAKFEPAIGFEYGLQLGVRDLGSADVSARGVLLRRRAKKLRTVSLKFPALTKVEAERAALPLLDYAGNTECLALCINPAPAPERQERCWFGPLVGDLSTTWATANGVEWAANLLGLM